MPPKWNVYLVDTDVIGELRKKDKGNRRVAAFFKEAAARDVPLSWRRSHRRMRRGAELVRHRGEPRQVHLLERWLERLVAEYVENVLPFNADAAQLWGRLRVPHPETRWLRTIHPADPLLLIALRKAVIRGLRRAAKSRRDRTAPKADIENANLPSYRRSVGRASSTLLRDQYLCGRIAEAKETTSIPVRLRRAC